MATKLPEIGSNLKWVRNAQLARHFNVTAMCIWRWKRDPDLKCPPSYAVNDIEWNDLDAWDAWMKDRVVSYHKETSKPSRADRLRKNRRSEHA